MFLWHVAPCFRWHVFKQIWRLTEIKLLYISRAIKCCRCIVPCVSVSLGEFSNRSDNIVIKFGFCSLLSHLDPLLLWESGRAWEDVWGIQMCSLFKPSLAFHFINFVVAFLESKKFEQLICLDFWRLTPIWFMMAVEKLCQNFSSSALRLGDRLKLGSKYLAFSHKNSFYSPGGSPRRQKELIFLSSCASMCF